VLKIERLHFLKNSVVIIKNTFIGYNQIPRDLKMISIKVFFTEECDIKKFFSPYSASVISVSNRAYPLFANKTLANWNYLEGEGEDRNFNIGKQ
jgi:hypothetical protein